MIIDSTDRGEFDVEFTKKGILFRGEFVQNYSTCESHLNHIIWMALSNKSYTGIGDFPYNEKSKKKYLDKIFLSDGFMSEFSAEYNILAEKLAKLRTYRKYIVHGFMLGFVHNDERYLQFLMYDYVGGKASPAIVRIGQQRVAMAISAVQELSNSLNLFVMKLSHASQAEGSVKPSGMVEEDFAKELPDLT